MFLKLQKRSRKVDTQWSGLRSVGTHVWYATLSFWVVQASMDGNLVMNRKKGSASLVNKPPSVSTSKYDFI